MPQRSSEPKIAMRPRGRRSQPLVTPSSLCPRCWNDISPDAADCGCGATRPADGWLALPLAFRGIYQLQERVSRGSGSAVFRAVDTRDSSAVLIKVQRRDGAREEVRRRLDALAAEQAGLLDVAQADEEREGDRHFPQLLAMERTEPAYLAMEQVSLPSLDVFVTERRLQSLEIVALGVSLCDGLAALERASIVHGALAPGNVYVRESDWHVVVADFAGWRRPNDPAFTRDDADALFTSPEQVSGTNVGTSADVHAAAALLWFAATGRSPYPQTDPDARRAALGVLPDRPAELAEGIYEILAWALAPSPEARPRADEMRRQLEAFRSGVVRLERVDRLRDRTRSLVAAVAPVAGLAGEVEQADVAGRELEQGAYTLDSDAFEAACDALDARLGSLDMRLAALLGAVPAAAGGGAPDADRSLALERAAALGRAASAEAELAVALERVATLEVERAVAVEAERAAAAEREQALNAALEAERAAAAERERMLAAELAAATAKSDDATEEDAASRADVPAASGLELAEKVRQLTAALQTERELADALEKERERERTAVADRERNTAEALTFERERSAELQAERDDLTRRLAAEEKRALDEDKAPKEAPMWPLGVALVVGGVIGALLFGMFGHNGAKPEPVSPVATQAEHAKPVPPPPEKDEKPAVAASVPATTTVAPTPEPTPAPTAPAATPTPAPEPAVKPATATAAPEAKPVATAKPAATTATTGTAAAPAAPKTEPAASPKKLVEQGWKAVEGADYAKARSLFEKAVSSGGGGDALYGRGYAREKSGDTSGAVSDYCKALDSVGTDAKREIEGNLRRLKASCGGDQQSSPW